MNKFLTVAAALAAFGAGGLVMTALTPAQAALGQPAASVAADQTRMKAQLRQVVGVGYTVDQMTTPAGTVVKEFISPAGIVFAVSWFGPTVPNLAQLLGSAYFQRLTAAQKTHALGRDHVQVRTPQLVVHAGGHMRQFYGLAYVPSLVPPNLAISDLH
jgi:hypothetical protein